jgi:hypothetical protein
LVAQVEAVSLAVVGEVDRRDLGRTAGATSTANGALGTVADASRSGQKKQPPGHPRPRPRHQPGPDADRSGGRQHRCGGSRHHRADDPRPGPGSRAAGQGRGGAGDARPRPHLRSPRSAADRQNRPAHSLSQEPCSRHSARAQLRARVIVHLDQTTRCPATRSGPPGTRRRSSRPGSLHARCSPAPRLAQHPRPNPRRRPP